jgi:3-oxosteroid 1-dehydrogenase
MQWDEEYDLVVLGGGAAGMTAALVAAINDARVLLIEKTQKIGGTSARSGGALWIPGIIGAADAAEALRYLDRLVDGGCDASLRESYVENGPRMVRHLERFSDVKFDDSPLEPDYRHDVPGAAQSGRALRARPYDGRRLGKSFDRLASPLPELMAFGAIMVTRPEVSRLVDLTSLSALAFGGALLGRYIIDRLTGYKRGTRLVLGNALIARLLRSLLDRDVDVWYGCETHELIAREREVDGVVTGCGGRERWVRAKRGVVLAGGGFPASQELRERYLPVPTARYTAAYQGCTGDTLHLAERAGAALEGKGDNALWFPSSIAKRRDGSVAIFPHITLDRPKPGLIAVNAAGKRFVNEASSYHEFGRAMYRSHQTVTTIPAMLICDSRFLWRYGLGMIYPHTLALRPFLNSGYLHRGKTLDELAQKIGVDANGLHETVRRNNLFASTGLDTDFGKGQSAYDLAGGDPRNSPNPCIGPIETSPFYAVAVVPTPLGTSLGLRTNANAQVLDRYGEAILGLYACGSDMASPMGNEYPGPGCQLGAGMTFAYVAALHALEASPTAPALI